MIPRTALALLVCSAALAGPRSAGAQSFPDNPLIAQGIDLYNDLEYEQSITMLQRALVRAENVPEQKIAIFQYLALDYLVLDRAEDAVQAFRQLLAIQPEYELDPAVFSPEHRRFLEGVRAQWESEGRPGWVSPESLLRPVVVNHELPAEAERDRSLDLQVSVIDPDGRLRQLVVSYRAPGEPGFVRVPAEAVAGGFAATVPGDRIQPPLIEYFFEALDAQGRVVGTRGDERSPLRVPVPGDEEGSIVEEWWFWTLIGVGVAASVAIPLAVVYGGEGSSSSDPATVTIILCDPGTPGSCP